MIYQNSIKMTLWIASCLILIGVTKGIVELYLPEEEKEKLDIALRDSNQTLPDRVKIVISPLPEPA